MRIKEKIVNIIDNSFRLFVNYKIKVLSIDKTLLIVENKDKKVVRFGDGEFSLIQGTGIPYQDYEPQLSERLSRILFSNKKDNLLICLPDVFGSLKKYSVPASKFWLNNLRKNRKIFSRLDRSYLYGNAFISRPYMELKDKSKATKSFTLIREIWKNKNLLIVEGKYTRSGIGNDLYDNAKSIKRIVCPSKNAFYHIKEIENAILKEKDDSIILLMLGPTAKIIVDDLSYLNNQIIDLGHIDTEYEWFKNGYTEKVKLNNKHTAEFNNDENIEPIHNVEYESQIVRRI